MNIKNKVFFIVLLTGLLTTGCGEQKDGDKPQPETAKTTAKATKVVVEKLAPYTFKKQIRVQGTIKPVNKAFISARMGGIIDSLNVKEGDYVKKGDLLFQTDKANLENGVIAAKKLVETSSTVENYAKADIPVAKANKSKIELDYNRDKGLFKNGAISRSDFEGTEVSYKSAIANVEKAEALTQAADTLTQQLATSLKIAEKNLADSKVYAPYDGYIVSKKMNEGEYAMPGMPVLEIENNNALEIVCRLSAVYYEALSNSTELNIEYAGKHLAKVPITYKAPNIDPLTRTFEIKGSVPAENGIISGLLCDVNIVLEQHEGIGISNKALIARKNGEYVVFFADGSKAVEQKVKVGLSNDGITEIVDNNALKDRNIIIKGNFYLNDGAPIVEVIEGDEK